MMRRIACLFLPEWPIFLERNRILNQRRENKDASALKIPVILVVRRNQQLVVRDCCEACQQAGIHTETSLTLARARAPAAHIGVFDSAGIVSAISKLALWAVKFTPRAAIDSGLMAPDFSSLAYGLVLDLTGTTRVHQGERALVNKIIAGFTRRGFCPRLAIAPTLGAAWALSRFYNDSPIIADQENFKELLTPLPIAALRLSSPTIGALTHLGLVNIARLLKISRRELTERFGTEVTLRLGQALGEVDELFEPIAPPVTITLARSFDIALTTHTALEKVLRGLLEDIFKQLQSQGRKAASFSISLYGTDIAFVPKKVSKELRLHSATQNFDHLRTIIQPLIEALPLFAGIDRVEVAANQLQRNPGTQKSFVDSDEQDIEQIRQELVNLLIHRLGEDNIKTVQFVASHIPEQSFRLQKLSAPQTLSTPPPLTERPPVLFETPMPAQVLALLPDHPPASIRLGKDHYRVVSGFGPERISPEWWKGKEASSLERDYFRIQDETGRWLWIYRETANQNWFVHGVWA